jgi:hypothetical protein
LITVNANYYYGKIVYKREEVAGSEEGLKDQATEGRRNKKSEEPSGFAQRPEASMRARSGCTTGPLALEFWSGPPPGGPGGNPPGGPPFCGGPLGANGGAPLGANGGGPAVHR